MTQLFETERHEPLLRDHAWDAARVDAAIEHIITRTRAVFVGRNHWPSHPDDADEAPHPLPSVYFGTAGIVWGLAQFGVRVPNDAALLRDAAVASVESLRAMFSDDAHLRGLLLGPSGIHTVALGLSQNAAVADTLYGLVRANVVNPVGDFMW